MEAEFSEEKYTFMKESFIVSKNNLCFGTKLIQQRKNFSLIFFDAKKSSKYDNFNWNRKTNSILLY